MMSRNECRSSKKKISDLGQSLVLEADTVRIFHAKGTSGAGHQSYGLTPTKTLRWS